MQAQDRKLLEGTSTHQHETMAPYPDPPANVDEIFAKLIVPVFTEVPMLKGKLDKDALRQLFMWATGAVASYSFEVGDDGFHVRPTMFCQCNNWVSWI